MTCACGRRNRAGARFCDGCGKPLAPRCPACGAEVRPDAQFCDACGAGLAERAADEAEVRKLVTIVFADSRRAQRSARVGVRVLEPPAVEADGDGVEGLRPRQPGGRGSLGERQRLRIRSYVSVPPLIATSAPGEAWERGKRCNRDLGNLSVEPSGYVPPGKGWPPAGTECCVVAE
jgi:hypothetical protein